MTPNSQLPTPNIGFQHWESRTWKLGFGRWEYVWKLELGSWEYVWELGVVELGVGNYQIVIHHVCSPIAITHITSAAAISRRLPPAYHHAAAPAPAAIASPGIAAR